MLVERGDAIGEAANVASVWRKIAADQAEQGGLPRTIGATDRDAFGTADRKRQRTEQAALAMRHDNLVESDQFAASGQSRPWQLDGERRQDFHAGPGSRKRVGAVSDQAVGEAAFAGAAVLGALLFCTEEHFRLAALGAYGASG